MRILPSIRDFIVPLFIVSLVSCGVHKQTVVDEEHLEAQIPKIVFVHCSIAFDSIQNQYQMELIDTIVTEGRVKNQQIHQTKQTPNAIRYCLMDKQKQALRCEFIANPLSRSVEYVNDQGQLALKTLNLSTSQLSLRVPFTGNCSTLSFEINDQQLLLIDLNE